MDFTGCQWRSVMGRFYSAVTIALSFRLYFFGAVLSVSLPLSLSLGPDSCVIYVWRVHRLYWDTRPAGLIKWQNEQPTCFSFMFLPIKKEEGEAKGAGGGGGERGGGRGGGGGSLLNHKFLSDALGFFGMLRDAQERFRTVSFNLDLIYLWNVLERSFARCSGILSGCFCHSPDLSE